MNVGLYIYILLFDDICAALAYQLWMAFVSKKKKIVDGFAYAAVSLLLDLSSFYLLYEWIASYPMQFWIPYQPVSAIITIIF